MITFAVVCCVLACLGVGMAVTKSSQLQAMHAAGAAISPIVSGIVKALEAMLDLIITEPNAHALLKTIEGWINSLLGIGNQAAAAQAMHAEAAKAGPFGGIFVKLIESLLGGLVGNPAVLTAILNWIQSLLSKPTTP